MRITVRTTARPTVRTIIQKAIFLFVGMVALSACTTTKKASVKPALASSADAQFMNEVQYRTFNWFWETTNPKNGLVPDRFPSKSFSSVAAVGFGLTAYPVGAERGWITRQQAADRVLNTLKFFWKAPQSSEALGKTGFKGFFYHFLDMDTGERFRTVELSTVDTALFMAGALFCQSYFDRNNTNEKAIRAYADSLYRRVEWNWAQVRENRISMGWDADLGMLPYDYWGYNETMLLYIMAMGSPTFPVHEDAWKIYTSSYKWGHLYGQDHLNFTPLFGHQYSHTWIDFRGIQDAFMRSKGIDYFENSRRATLAQQQYAIANPDGWKDYGATIWGLTACDGPLDIEREFNGKVRHFRTYSARGVSTDRTEDDGTLSPTAAGGSVAFTPEISLAALKAMKERYGNDLFGRYGFLDSFNPSFTFKDVKVQHGKVTEDKGWFDTDYLGIDQGPILLMMENARTELIWKYMRKNPYILNGLRRAGFTGGWMDTAQPNVPATSFSPQPMPLAMDLPNMKRLVVLGSSTSEGVGPKEWENTYVNRLRKDISERGDSIQVINLAKGSYTTFHLLPDPTAPSVAPSGTTKPVRPEPDVRRNISQALRLKPDALLINLPSNDVASGFSVQEQLQNFQVILELAKNAGVEVWVTTTQPRNMDASKMAAQIQVRDGLKNLVGDHLIDFWTDIAETNGTIKAQYDSGDHIHLNDEAHALLLARVKASSILEKVRKK